MTREGGRTTTTIFTPCCGKPLQISMGSSVTNFKYYDNGLLKEKIGPSEHLELDYDPRFKKVTKVKENNKSSYFVYDTRGNLVEASNSDSDKIVLKYDESGRIIQMTDNRNRVLTFKYNQSNRPVYVSEKGVGTIIVEYDENGKIIKTGTVTEAKAGRLPSATPQDIIQRVMQGFQRLLEVLRPASIALAY